MNRDNCCSKIYITNTIICIIYIHVQIKRDHKWTYKWQINIQTLIYTHAYKHLQNSPCLCVCLSVSVSSRVMMRRRKHDHITPTFRIRLATCAWLHSPQAGHENLPHSLSLRSFCHTLHPVFSDQRVSHLLMYLGLRTEKQSSMASEPSDTHQPFPVEFPTQEH